MISLQIPRQLFAAHNVNMQMADSYSSVVTYIYYYPVTINKLQRFRDFRYFFENMRGIIYISAAYIVQRFDMNFRNAYNMHGSGRVYIVKSKNFIVFIYFFRREFPRDYFAENTIFHKKFPF